MKYDSLSRNTVKITLSEEDMREYSLCAGNISLSTAETKRSLSRMLRKMKLFQGYRPERLFLEAFPKSDGGCVLYVSSLFEEAEKDRTTEAAVMCCLESLDSLIRLCRAAESLRICMQTCVYRSRGGYLLVAVTEGCDFFAVKKLFSEFGRVCTDPSEICVVSEYAEPVCFCDACRIFSELY